MNQKNEIIHKERFLKFENIIPSLLLIIIWGFLFRSSKSEILILLCSITIITIFWFLIRRNSTYIVYEDRIQFYNPFSNNTTYELKLDEISQIRFEDSFTDSYGGFSSNYIILYPQKNAKTGNTIKDRITLGITGFNKVSTIVKLIKFFQSKNIEVVIKTESSKIHNETELKNWDQA